MKTYNTEFPLFALDVKLPAGFVDNSYGNDMCPNFIKGLDSGFYIQLWIDYSAPELREVWNECRFCVAVKNDDLDFKNGRFTNGENVFISDDYSAVLAFLSAFVFDVPAALLDSLPTLIFKV